MRKKIFHLIALGLVALGGLTACQADMDTPPIEVPEAAIKANITLLDLKQAYEGKYNQHIYMPGTWITDDEGNITGGDPVYVHGRVISSDATGNIYKSLVIQDETAALAFSINQGSLYNEYRLGQEMVIDLTGLYIGYYRELQQIGWPGDPYRGTPQLGFMAYDYWLASAQRNGLPDPTCITVSLNSDYPTDNYYMIAFNNFDELNQATAPELQSQLVEFRNVHFQINEGEETYAPYQESVNRTLVDATGQTLTVRNSGYSNFYNERIPEGKGIVRGILSYYGGSWQLLLRGLGDVLISDRGTEEDPYTVEDVTGGEWTGMSGWTKGYIVGSVKAGVSHVSGNEDVIFGKDGEIDNNVLIAQSADETDYTKCVVVELPQNSMMRYVVNLADNPGMYKKELTVDGTLGEWLGMSAITGCTGTKASFLIDGQPAQDGSEPPAATGAGTEDNPYNVTFVMQSTQDYNDVWVEGYVAGYVVSGNYLESNCEFSANQVANSTNYLNQTNVILSGVATPLCNFQNSVPGQLTGTSRPVLGLKDNPSVYGKRVKVKCNIRDWLGTRALRNISTVVVL